MTRMLRIDFSAAASSGASGRRTNPDQVCRKASALQMAKATTSRTLTRLPAFASVTPWKAKRSTRQPAAAATSEPIAVAARRSAYPPSWFTQVVP